MQTALTAGNPYYKMILLTGIITGGVMGITITSKVSGLGPMDGLAPVQTCSCALCSAASANGQTAPHAMAGGLSLSADTQGAAFLDQKQDASGFYYYSGDRNIDAVLIGTKWTGTNLTFSFPDSGNVYGYRYDFGQNLRQVEFNDAQKGAARTAFSLIAGYTNLTFTELPADSAERPTIRLSSTQLQNVGSAMGYFPGVGDDVAGDIWFGRTQQPYYETPQRGNWGYVTILHEIGHTMGLKHGHSDYTNEDLGGYFGVDRAFHGTRALEYDKDGQAWSLMSYTNAPNSIPGFNGDERNSAQTYMMYDIAALQYMYGANYTTNAGDTVYKWDPNSGTMSINGVAQGAPAFNKVFETIWDGGGVDTYDLSAYTGNMSLDLRPGQLSTVSTAQLVNAEGYFNGNAPVAGNIANALLFEGNIASLIENAIGGSGDDRITGNQANNRLEGGTGNDWLAGGVGNDMLIGGAGNDVADFSDATGAISVTLNNDTADITVANGTDRDVIRGVEGIVGTAYADNLVGDRADNLLSGGSGGRDYLNGGDGNDTMIGATDTISYADKPDMVEVGEWGNQTRATAVKLDDSFELAPRLNVERATELPHATVKATGPGGGADYYSFTGTAGSTIILDIDNVSPETTAVELLDNRGRVLASNFGIDQTDAGSRNGGTPMLNFVLPQSGTFYVRVGGYTTYFDSYGQGTPALGGFNSDTPYTLNVSVEGAKVDSTTTAIGSGRFYGGAGDDVIVAASGDDLVSGGAGTDTLSYIRARAGVTVDLTVTRAQNTGGSGTDTITGIENLTGSKFDDTLKGDAGNNVINGGGGNDVLSGGAGIDTLSFAGYTRGVSFDLSAQGYSQYVQAGARVTATGFENLTGSAADDYLAGDAAANVIRAGAGDDVLVGNASGTTGGVDTLDGGSGFDTARFSAVSGGIIATMQGGGAGTVTDAQGGALATLAGIEAIEGGWGNDVLLGDDDANSLIGSGGDDRLVGGAGDDMLEGGWGDDVIQGGTGNDTAIYSGYGTYFVDLTNTGAQDTGLGTDTLSGIENLKGGWGNDYFFGDANDNRFIDVGGDDLYSGRGGSDTVDYSAVTGLLTVDLRIGYQQNTRAAGMDLLDTIENVVGGNFGNIIFGAAGANRLVGGSSTDVLIGGDGTDRLEGGAGNDLLIGDGMGATDPATIVGVSMDDVLIGGAGADRLIGGEGDDVLIGGSGGDVLIGGNAVVRQYGDNFVLESLVLGDGGRDTLNGGDGDDYGVLFYYGRTEAITLDISNVQATNAVYFDGVAHGSVTSVETLRFYGGINSDRITTGSGYDQVQGGAGDDWISTGGGDDFVNGGAGNDWMDGGEGMNTLSFSGATAGVTVDLRRTDAQDTGGAGIDTIRNFSNVSASSFGDTISGDDGSNTIRDTFGGSDTFYGRGGSDYLSIGRQYGDTTAQTFYLDGGDGSDVLEYASSPIYNRQVPTSFYRLLDTVTMIGGEGRDGLFMVGQKVGVIDAGAGDDEVTIGMGGIVDTSVDITLGSGADLLMIDYTDNYLGSIDRLNNIVRDFQTGAGGDRVDFTYLRASWDLDINPFSDGRLRLVQVGNDVRLQMNVDTGTQYNWGWTTFLTFQNTKVENFTADNFQHKVGDGIFEPIVEKPIDPRGGAVAFDTIGDAAFRDESVVIAHAFQPIEDVPLYDNRLVAVHAYQPIEDAAMILPMHALAA